MSRNIDDINPEFFETLLQMDLKRYDQYRSDFPFLKPVNVMMAIGSHDLEKHLDWQYREVLKELGPDHEVTKLYHKLVECVEDMGWALSGHRHGAEDKILKKYSHNIMSVLSDNNLLLSTKSELVVKEEVGNKAFKLWEMSKNGLPVPDAFFLTYAATRLSYTANQVLPGFLRKALYYFKGEAVAIRSSGNESMPGMLETIYVTDSSDYEKVSAAIVQVINSWYNEKAVKYRKLCKIDDLMKIGVVIQLLVKADNKKGFSGSAFSRNPTNGDDELNGEVLFQEMGAELASGEKTPEKLDKIPAKFYNELQQHVKALEKKYRQVQYVEFASDGEKLYMLQTRDAKLSELAKAKVAIDFYKMGWMDSTRLERLYNDLRFSDALRKYETNATPITKGLASSPGVLTGKIILMNEKFSKSSEFKYIWFTDISTTNDLHKIKLVDGIVTTKGGYTSHPAEVSRMLNKPSVVSAKNLQIFNDHVKINDKVYREGDIITIIGDTGEIFEGEIETKSVFILEKEFKKVLK